MFVAYFRIKSYKVFPTFRDAICVNSIFKLPDKFVTVYSKRSLTVQRSMHRYIVTFLDKRERAIYNRERESRQGERERTERVGEVLDLSRYPPPHPNTQHLSTEH